MKGVQFESCEFTGVLTNLRFLVERQGRPPGFIDVDMTAADISWVDIERPSPMEIRLPEDLLLIDDLVDVTAVLSTVEGNQEGVAYFEKMYRSRYGWALNSHAWLRKWLGEVSADAVIAAFANNKTG